MKYIISIAIVAAFTLMYVVGGFTTVEPGEYAIKIKQFGDDKGVLDEGLAVGTHWVDPFLYDVEIYDTKAKQHLLEVQASTKDGQPVSVVAGFEISLLPDKVKTLHSLIGRDYYERVVAPAATAAIRDALPTQLSDRVYTDEGRAFIQGSIGRALDEKQIESRGITAYINLQEIRFLNPDFVRILEEKAGAAQREEIERRYALAAEQEAIKVANAAEGEKQKRIKAAEAQREELRLEGEGNRLRDEETAAGLLALAQSEAEGQRLLVAAYEGDPQVVASIRWAEHLGPNVKVYGFPTGAPGTSSIVDVSGVIKNAFSPEK